MEEMGKHVIVDCTPVIRTLEMTDEDHKAAMQARISYRDPTDAEIADFKQRQVDHEAAQTEYAKVKYLDDRKNDVLWPQQAELNDALIDMHVKGDSTKMDALKARIAQVEAKYPAPTEVTA